MTDRRRQMLIVIGSLPATRKTTIARELGRQMGAVLLRIDSMEQAIRAAGAASQPLNDAGCFVAYAAGDNLRIGRTVIADSLNPIQLTRDAWVKVAKRTQVNVVEIEVKYSDVSEHRRRVETRTTDISGLRLPTWEEIVSRELRWALAFTFCRARRRAVLRGIYGISPDVWRSTDMVTRPPRAGEARGGWCTPRPSAICPRPAAESTRSRVGSPVDSSRRCSRLSHPARAGRLVDQVCDPGQISMGPSGQAHGRAPNREQSSCMS
jgi:predicted kinase